MILEAQERYSFTSDVSVPAVLCFRVISIAFGLTGMLYAELKLATRPHLRGLRIGP